MRRAIAEMSGDIAIFQDADLEYDPNDYQRLLSPILAGRRTWCWVPALPARGKGSLLLALRWQSASDLAANMVNDMNLTDMEACYKVFTALKYSAASLEANRFGIEPEVAAKVARNRMRVYEVPQLVQWPHVRRGEKNHLAGWHRCVVVHS